jgi:V-type H+-transporting ATPase subunit D
MSAMPAPTRMALTLFKGKLKGAKKGFDLLKKKADALKVRLRAMTKEIYDVSNHLSLHLI